MCIIYYYLFYFYFCYTFYAHFFLSPFTYDVHTEAINLLMLLLSGQLFSDVPFTSAIVQSMMEVPM